MTGALLLAEFPAIPHEEGVSSAILCAVFCSVLLLSCLKASATPWMQRHISLLLPAAFSSDTDSVEQTVFDRSYNIVGGILFALNISIILHLFGPAAGQMERLGLSEWASIPLTVVAVLLLYLFKFLICKGVGRFFFRRALYDDYASFMWLLLRLLGFLLTPCVILMPFVPDVWTSRLLCVAGVLGLMSLAARWKRGFSLNVGGRFSIIYFILYLCTFEFAPILLFWKMYISEF